MTDCHSLLTAAPWHLLGRRSDATLSKDVQDKAQAYGTRLIGVVVEGGGFYGVWSHPTFKQGAANTCSILTSVLGRQLASKGLLPRVLVLQLDNTAKENKNNLVIKYCGLLVRMDVFKEVQIVFLPVGHTHAKIDQRFSVVSRALHAKDCLTLPQMEETLSGLDLGGKDHKGVFFEVLQSLNYEWLNDKAVSFEFKGIGTFVDEDNVRHSPHCFKISWQVSQFCCLVLFS